MDTGTTSQTQEPTGDETAETGSVPMDTTQPNTSQATPSEVKATTSKKGKKIYLAKENHSLRI